MQQEIRLVKCPESVGWDLSQNAFYTFPLPPSNMDKQCPHVADSRAAGGGGRTLSPPHSTSMLFDLFKHCYTT